MTWQWKANKGSPYAEDMGTWSDAMAIAMGSDKPAPIMIDRHPISANARVAYPWTLPTMSRHIAFRRQPVDQQYAQALRPTTLPAPTRGINQMENEAFMQPGSCIISDNWVPTLRGVKLRGGYTRWCELPETTPVISAFEYASGNVAKMFAANATKLYDVTSSTPVLVKAGQASGNYVASQLANASGDYLLALNDAGDFPLRYKTSWVTLDPGCRRAGGRRLRHHLHDASDRTDPGQGPGLRLEIPQSLVLHPGQFDERLVPAAQCGRRRRCIEIPLSGAATKGGKLLWGATWSIDAGDGIDDKCVFCTDQGELLIFTGSDPSNINSWRQEGRYQIAPPMGMNAHTLIGGDLIILTVDGMVPISLAIQKDAGQMELATLTRMIKPLWRENVETGTKRANPWTIKKWDEYGAFFVAIPGGKPGQRYCLASNNTTGAWCRFMGWDATCFIRMRADMFFGTQDGIVMQADRTGYDDGHPYIATLVGGWEMFKAPSQQVTLHQMRAIFTSRPNEPFLPQLSATTDFQVVIPAAAADRPRPRPAGPLGRRTVGRRAVGCSPARPAAAPQYAVGVDRHDRLCARADRAGLCRAAIPARRRVGRARRDLRNRRRERLGARHGKAQAQAGRLRRRQQPEHAVVEQHARHCRSGRVARVGVGRGLRRRRAA